MGEHQNTYTNGSQCRIYIETSSFQKLTLLNSSENQQKQSKKKEMILSIIPKCLHGGQIMLAKWVLEVIPAATKFMVYLNLRTIRFLDFALLMLPSEIQPVERSIQHLLQVSPYICDDKQPVLLSTQWEGTIKASLVLGTQPCNPVLPLYQFKNLQK